MLKKYGQIFQGILFLMDMAVISSSWISSYFLRFYTGPIPVFKGVVSFTDFLYLLVFLVPIHALVFRNMKLYEPMRSHSRGYEVKTICKATLLATLIFITLLYLIKENKYSRIVFVYFLIINIVFLSVFRSFIRFGLGYLRKNGYNLRHVLIIGDGKLAQDVAKKLSTHVEFGFKVGGFLSKDEAKIGGNIESIPVLGTYRNIKEIIKKGLFDEVIFAIPLDHIRMIKVMLGQIYDEMVEIKVVPDLFEYFTLRKGIEMLDDLPIIGLRESPLYGWNKIVKRAFDIIVSIMVLTISLPILCIIALLIKCFSPGPIFYKQQRMGLDGKLFKIIKFRSMIFKAESSTGPVWAMADDERRTRLGTFLRRTNLDELPQFINVLKGDMSVVGPRPERPEFMQKFKESIPLYMLRHTMRAGITGWAQVNGLRGNTSIEERTQYDLYYIEHWSIWFDIKILLKTLFALKNAY